MAITFSQRKRYGTQSPTIAWNNQPQASLYFDWRFESSGDPATATNAFLVSRDSYSSIYIIIQGAGSTPGTVRVKFAILNASNITRSVTQDIPVGSVQSIAMTHDGIAGSQVLTRNGIAIPFGTLTGNTFSASRAMLIGGWDSLAVAGSVHTIDNLAIWHGYVLTLADIIGLRDKAIAPSDIGAGATLRAWWSLAGTLGSPVNVGDPGLAEANGNAGLNFTATLGTGTAVYSNTLSWAPAVSVSNAGVTTSGRSVAIQLASIATGVAVSPTTVYDAPTISVNGVSYGPLEDAYCTGTATFIMFNVPSGLSIGHGDYVTLDAPDGWLDTTGGLAKGMSTLPIAVNTGKSCFGTDTLQRTLKVGYNFSGEATGHDCIYNLPKNWRFRAGSFLRATVDASNKPISFTGTSSQAPLWGVAAQSGIDATGTPGPTGLFAVGWDDLDPAHPTTFYLGSNNGLPDSTTTYTERLDLKNNGDAQGRGKVRVFDIQRNPTSTVVSVSLYLWVSQASGTPRFDNLVIYGPGDFAYQDNIPVVLDLTNPLDLSATARDRLGTSAGSFRWMDTITGYAGSINTVEPSDVTRLTDWSWGFGNNKVNRTIGYTSVRPYSQATSPYFYSPTFGSPFNATLAAPIDAATTVLTITDAATAPVIAGLRLLMDGEIMQVLDVSGVSVTVERGSESTVAIPHAAGTIQVGYRFPSMTPTQLTVGHGLVAEFVTNGQHYLRTGVSTRYSGTGWPTMTWTDGTQTTPTNFGAIAWVTGPNTYAIGIFANNTVAANLSTTYPVNPATAYTTYTVGGPQLPYEYPAMVTSRISGASLHLNVPGIATDALVDDMASRVRDSFPAGQPVWVELSNEPWNASFAQWRYFNPLSLALYPGKTYYASVIERSKVVWQRFRDRFDEGGRGRGSQIKTVLNFISTNASDCIAALNYCATQSPPIKIDAVSIAPYIDAPSDAATVAAYNVRDADQCLDLYIHWLYYAAGSSNFVPVFRAYNQAVANYNAATGYSCVLIGYEGGMQLPVPAGVPNRNELARDMQYSPNNYIVQQDWFGLLQRNGFSLYNEFCYAYTNYPWVGTYALWGHYHGPFQHHGRGDGSDGKADNRLCLAMPGQPHTKPATTNQDLVNVSARGQAWLDWNAEATPPPPTKRLRFLPRSIFRVK